MNGADTFTDLQAALDAAPSDATILVCPGTYTGQFTRSLPASIVSHGGAEVTVLDGAMQGSTLRISAGSSIVGLTISGGHGVSLSQGGGIDMTSTGTLLVDRCVISGNSLGGGLRAPDDAVLTIRDTLVAENGLAENGLAENELDFALSAGERVALDLTGSTFSGNGAGIYMRSGSILGGVVTESFGFGITVANLADVPLQVTNTEISHNGAGMYLVGGGGDSEASLTDVSISHNEGGGLQLLDIHAALVGTEISDNTAEYGAGIRLYGNCSVTGGSVINNTATIGGGGILLDQDYLDDILLRDVLVEGNSAPDGAGIFIVSETSRPTSIVGGRLSNNTATGRGGALAMSGCYYCSEVSFEGVEISDNTAAEGGGLFIEGGYLSIEDSALLRNTASVGGGAFVALQGSLVSEGSDWGLGIDANTPGDVFASEEYSGYGSGASFSCSEEGCTPVP